MCTFLCCLMPLPDTDKLLQYRLKLCGLQNILCNDFVIQLGFVFILVQVYFSLNVLSVGIVLFFLFTELLFVTPTDALAMTQVQ